jgi:uncharacterized membrane protein YpjA
VLARLLAGFVLLSLWAGALVVLSLVVILSLFRLGLWAIVLVLVLAIVSGNLPLAFVMVLLLGSVLAGRVRD